MNGMPAKPHIIWMGALAGLIACPASSMAQDRRSAGVQTRFETIDRYPDLPVKEWDQYKNCSLGPNAPVTEAEKEGRFTGTAANANSKILVGETDAKKIVQQIVQRSDVKCKQGANLDALILGAKEALDGKKFIPSLSGTAQLDQGGPLSILSDQRKACRNESIPEEAQRQCCLQGFLSTIPQLNAFILEVPDPEDAERRSCREAYDFGRMHSRFACTHKDKESACAEPIQACIPVRHLGCFHLGYTAYWVSDECTSTLKNSAQADQFRTFLATGVITDRKQKDASPAGPSTGSMDPSDRVQPREGR